MEHRKSNNILTHWRVLWGNLWLFFWAVFFSFCAACLSLTLPLFMLLVYDRVLNARSQETLVVLCVLAIGSIITMGILDYVRRRLLARFAASLQDDLEDHLLPIQPSHCGLNRDTLTGTKHLDGLRGFVHSPAMRHIIDVAWVPIFVGAVFLLSAKLGWLSITGLVTVIIVYVLGWAISSHRLREMNNATGNARTKYNAAVRSAKWLPGQTFGAKAKDRLIASRDEARFRVISAADRTTAVDSTLTTVRWIMSILVLSAAAGLVLAKELTIGGMVASVILTNKIYFPFIAFLTSLPNLKAAIANWTTIGEQLQSIKRTEANVSKRDESGPLLELRSVDIVGDIDASAVIGRANLTIERKQIVQITGDFCSGKTILCETIVGARIPARGTLSCTGTRLSALSHQEIGARIGYVPEQPVFIKGTIAANISGLADHDGSLGTVQAAKLAELHHRIMRLPRGYATQIDEMGHPLARSDLHLLALARAVYLEPSLLVIDEPSQTVLSLFAKQGQKTLQQFISSGGSLILTGRYPIDLEIPNTHYRLEEGELRQQSTVQPSITPIRAAATAIQ